jgi:hypothetical protein
MLAHVKFKSDTTLNKEAFEEKMDITFKYQPRWQTWRNLLDEFSTIE